MTLEEASIIIGNIPIPLVILGTHDKCYSLTEYQNAKAMAIKSLEAWEKMREEIKYHADNIKYTDAYRDGFEVSLKIIDKHLAEVSE